MKKYLALLLAACLLAACLTAVAEEAVKVAPREDRLVVTRHTTTIQGREIAYTPPSGPWP